MSTATVEFNEQQEMLEAPEELRISEGAGLVPTSLREQIEERAAARGIVKPPGARLLQVIRPGIGGGRGTRYYSPKLLETHAEVFSGARMFKNHLTEKQRKDLDGLPRPIDHLGGRLTEAWWDGHVPADDRFEQGGVYAYMKPVRQIAEVIDDDPELIEASISALATAIRPAKMNGRNVTVVEGIRSKPVSVDWVTEGGAGGKVLTEAAEQEEAVLESMSDEEIREYMEKERPGLLEAIKATATDPDGDGDDDTAEIEARAAKHLKAGKSRKAALALARQEIAADADNETQEGAEMPEGITTEALAEALATDEGKAALAPHIAEALSSYEPAGYVRADEMNRLVESAMAEKADLIRIEARGDLERQIELRDMEARAKSLAEAANLHPRLSAKIVERFRLNENGEPSEALNLAAEIDEEGNIVKRPMELLVEAVEAEIEDARQLQGELRPTRVRGAGRSTRLTESRETEEGKKKEGDEPVARKTTGSSLTDELLEAAGFEKNQLDHLWVNGG